MGALFDTQQEEGCAIGEMRAGDRRARERKPNEENSIVGSPAAGRARPACDGCCVTREWAPTGTFVPARKASDHKR